MWPDIVPEGRQHVLLMEHNVYLKPASARSHCLFKPLKNLEIHCATALVCVREDRSSLGSDDPVSVPVTRLTLLTQLLRGSS